MMARPNAVVTGDVGIVPPNGLLTAAFTIEVQPGH